MAVQADVANNAKVHPTLQVRCKMKLVHQAQHLPTVGVAVVVRLVGLDALDRLNEGVDDADGLGRAHAVASGWRCASMRWGWFAIRHRCCTDG